MSKELISTLLADATQCHLIAQLERQQASQLRDLMGRTVNIEDCEFIRFMIKRNELQAAMQEDLASYAEIRVSYLSGDDN